MRHRIAHKHFNRDSNHRKAMLKNLVRSLVVDGAITTTRTKAKEAQRISDKLIHKAQEGTIAVRRTLHMFFGRRDVVNTLVERVAPAMSDRVSGFSRIIVVGNRKGDNADLVRLELVNQPATIGTLKSGQDHTRATSKSTKKALAKPAAKAAGESVAKPVAKPVAVAKKPTAATKAKPAAAKKPTAKAKVAKKAA